jgi:pilus assembly protein CpaE
MGCREYFMAAAVRVVVFNAEEGYAAPLRTMLLALHGVKIVAEVDEVALLPQAITRFPCDVLVANLDPAPEAALAVLGQVAEANPGQAIFAVSESTDGQLILAAMRSGIREFLTKPVEEDVLREALDKVAVKTNASRKQGTLITVIGGAGGVGATTIAVNLAVEMNVIVPRRVAVVDLDHRFGQVAMALDVEPQYTIADLCDTPEQLDPQMIERALVKHRTGTRVLSRPLHFQQADNITAAHCVGVLSALTQYYDYVIVDGPTRFDFGAKAVLDIADVNLIVLQLVVPTVRSVHRMIQGMLEIGYNVERMRLVCNRVGCAGGGIDVADVQSTLNLDVFGEIPDDWAAVNGAMNTGEPLFTSAPKSKARTAIKALAARLHDPNAAPVLEEPERKRGGLLSKIF